MVHIDSICLLKDRVDFEVSQHLVLLFHRSKSVMLFCSPLNVHFSTIKHLLLALSNWQISYQFLMKSLRPLNHSGGFDQNSSH